MLRVRFMVCCQEFEDTHCGKQALHCNLQPFSHTFFIVLFSKIGFLIGSSAMMTALNLMTAIYWGQLSYCKPFSTNFSQYSCSQPHAYGAVCAFAVFIFLTQLSFVVGVTWWRGELINEAGLYDQVPTTAPYETSKLGGAFAQPPPSADLWRIFLLCWKLLTVRVVIQTFLLLNQLPPPGTGLEGSKHTNTSPLASLITHRAFQIDGTPIGPENTIQM